MTTPLKLRRYSALLFATALLMGACSSGGGSTSNDTVNAAASSEGHASSSGSGPSEAAASAPSAASQVSGEADAAHLPTVPGYAPGEIPAIPLFLIPDTSVISSKDSKFDFGKTEAIASIPGVTIAPAKCEGNVVTSGNMILGGDGSGNNYQDKETTVNGGDGSGSYIDDANKITITNGGDGSGMYVNDLTKETITVDSTGKGTYVNDLTKETYVIGGDGTGNYVNDTTKENILIGPNGTGTYINEQAGITIINGGDGTSTYTNKKLNLNIRNGGNGFAYVNNQRIPAKPTPPVPRLGKMAPIPAVAPVQSCGTVITLEDGVLFDFGKSEVRADAQEVVDKLATVFTDLKVPHATVVGHTDSISDDASNMTLSQERAGAIVKALQAKGVSTALQAEGKGETQPITPNENADGSDNPAGRQLNRRVEIFVPNF